MRFLAAFVGIMSLLAASGLLVDERVEASGRVDLDAPPPPVAASGPAMGPVASTATTNPDRSASLPTLAPTTVATAMPGAVTPGIPDRASEARIRARQEGHPTVAPTETGLAATSPPSSRVTLPAPPTVPTRSARLEDLNARRRAAVPTALDLPTLDLEVPVIPVGVRDDGLLDVPDDVDEAGWYRFGPTPGAAGNSVIAGHVDDRVQGLGAFHRLADLVVGDPVTVTRADGSTTTWTVTGRDLVDKDALESSALFRDRGPTQLVLVTCGGSFDPQRRSYRGNVVVVAEPG